MINNLLAYILKVLIWLRYKVRVRGLETVKKKGRSGILFLPNHPALIEPIILISHLYKHFRVRALADEEQVNRFFIRNLAHRTNVLTIPDLGRTGMQSVEQVRKVIDKCIEALKQGDNLLLYPAGRIYRQNTEQIGANSAVERIIKALPDTRIVLVRTKGLWGSGFSWAAGYRPLVKPVLLKGLKAILLNGIFFTPRRAVDIELAEPEDFPRMAERMTINTYLENFYNSPVEKNTCVPYTIWEHGGTRICPEPEMTSLKGDVLTVSPSVRRQVYRHLQDVSGTGTLNDGMSLVQDLGMDSLAVVELITWLESEYGYTNIEVDALRSVEDVLLAASGTVISWGEKISYRIPEIWFKNLPVPQRPEQIKEMTIPHVFLYQASRQPNKVAIADQMSGVLTYRKMVLAIMLLKKKFAGLKGDYVGIMFPASAAVGLVYLAALFAGKIPVMINWTLGRRNLKHALESLDIKHIITARALLSRIEAQGIGLNEFKEYFVLIEDLRSKISWREKFCAFAKAYIGWSELQQATLPETAVVLFTSGSESLPKAVPLTHKNILTNVSDAYECFTLSEKDSFLGILPPFHSFGLTVSMILPLCLGSRVFFYPNPAHGGALAQIISAYKLTILPGTPTFLNGILRASKPEQLHSLRLVVSGAEKCPQRVYDLISELCPYTKVLEGYGTTECSPVISVNHENDPHNGTIGRVMPSLEYAIVDPESGKRLPGGCEGLLLVRGESVFGGYLNHDGASPFVEFENKLWYRTGDLVVEDNEGILSFCGRLKRFIKLGGELVSLPAIESVLEQSIDNYNEEGPILAVLATPNDEKPEIILFSTREITRESANRIIREAGLSGLHNIRQVRYIESLPLLGTGKVDYKSLVAQLASESGIS